MNTTPRKHAALIKAWADGAEIEYFDDCKNLWTTTKDPIWSENLKYRVRNNNAVVFGHAVFNGVTLNKHTGEAEYIAEVNEVCDYCSSFDNLELTFDPITKKLLKAAVRKTDWCKSE